MSKAWYESTGHNPVSQEADWRKMNSIAFSSKRPGQLRHDSKMIQIDRKRREREEKELLESLYGY